MSPEAEAEEVAAVAEAAMAEAEEVVEVVEAVEEEAAHRARANPTHVAQRPARYQDRCVRRGLRSQSLLL